MKVLARKVWEEPAAAGALLLSIALLLGEVLIGDGLQSSDLPTILAPLGAGALIRSGVRPSAKANARAARLR